MKSLTEKMCFRYPKIFVRKKLPITQSCMAWGCECGDGWGRLIDELCRCLQYDTDHNGYPQVEATQVKEKYGTLRFYFSRKDDGKEYSKEKYAHQEGIVSFAEHMSAWICETCGSTDNVQQTNGWIVTLCEKHMKEYLEKHK